ncbi:MAG TPA: glutaredoxin domain-containing protein [Polyangia bacterium]|nr:glutaredoxin domain-containing protein [Polyangia bacterium]
MSSSVSLAARRAALLLAMLAAAPACRRSAPEAPPAPKAAPAVVEVLKGGRWLFTYIEPSGTFSTTDKPETVPEGSRAMVRVFDPSDPAKTDAPGQVYVADLNVLVKSGKATAKPVSREAFETAAIAQLPPGESSALAGHGAPSGAEPPPPLALGDAGAPSGQPVVTIYGTSWCGACRAAREYLTQRRVPFVDKDVERDPAAARELSEKASKMGIPTDRVPVIDVRGRLLQGFDRARIDALLGEPT